MVREFRYGGDRFRATVHVRPGKEEIFIVQVLDDDEDGAEISLDRFEDAGNDPAASLEAVLVRMVDQLRQEQSLTAPDAAEAFAWQEGRPLRQPA